MVSHDITALISELTLQVSQDSTFVRIFVFTWAEWLDVMEFTVHKDTVEVRQWTLVKQKKPKKQPPKKPEYLYMNYQSS